MQNLPRKENPAVIKNVPMNDRGITWTNRSVAMNYSVCAGFSYQMGDIAISLTHGHGMEKIRKSHYRLNYLADLLKRHVMGITGKVNPQVTKNLS